MNTDQSGRKNIPIGGEPDCSRHKKEIAGISDMKVLAEMIGDMHYETLAELFNNLQEKLSKDALKDKIAGRKRIAAAINEAAYCLSRAKSFISDAWQISKPFMNDKTQSKGQQTYKNDKWFKVGFAYLLNWFFNYWIIRGLINPEIIGFVKDGNRTIQPDSALLQFGGIMVLVSVNTLIVIYLISKIKTSE
jgi:hypothetical protein